MKKLKIKIITGFRRDQEYTIDADEAHKAYYLFLNPEQRGVFSNGVAMIGEDIKHIAPDYNATMGWNPTYTPQGDDWNEIRATGTERDFERLLSEARRIASEEPEKLNTPMRNLMLEIGVPQIHTNGPKAIGDIIKKQE